MKNKKKVESEAMQSILELPGEILQHILSFLPTKEATKTSVLSKAWYSAWQTCPVICFREHHFLEKTNDPNLSHYERRRNDREKFLSAVKKVLQRYHEQKIRIDTLKLWLKPYYRSSEEFPLICEWISVAAENGLQKLELEVEHLSLPLIVLEAKYLEDLSICRCKIEQQIIENLMCCNLRRLVLQHVSLNDEIFHSIISTYQLIEDLEIFRCQGLENIKVRNLRNLKKFLVCYPEKQIVEVEAPNLEFFTCENSSYLASVWRPCMVNFLPSQNLKRLILSGIDISDFFFLDFTLKFPHLEDMTIGYCHDLHRIKICSHSLKILRFYSNKQLEELNIDAPKIVLFEYKGKILSRVSFTNATSRWKSIIQIFSHERMDNSWFSQMKALVTNLSQSRIFLDIFCDQFITFNINEINDCPTLFPGPGIEKLSLTIDQTSGPAEFLALLDGCFWTCRPKTISQWWICRGSVKFAKFLHEMLVGRRNQDDLSLHETKFWQHDLKEVKVKIYKKTGTLWELELDLGALSKVSLPLDGGRIVDFNLEW